MSEKPSGHITITVPWHEKEGGRYDDAGNFTDSAGRAGVFVQRSERQVRVFISDICEQIGNAWPLDRGAAAPNYEQALAELAHLRAHAATLPPSLAPVPLGDRRPAVTGGECARCLAPAPYHEATCVRRGQPHPPPEPDDEPAVGDVVTVAERP